jgi:hypothetical protein
MYPTLTADIPMYSWKISYYEMTEGEALAFQNALTNSNEDRMKEIITGLIKSWNCTDREGNKLPVTAEALDMLPTSVLKILITEILSAGAVSLSPKAKASSSQPTAGGQETTDGAEIRG